MNAAPLLLRLAAVLGLLAAASAPAAIMPATHVAYDKTTNTMTLSWHGEPGHTYFAQHSLNLHVWLTAPLIETGNDLPLAWSVQANPEKSFFRLLFTDLPTGGNPETADFDGDGLSNLLETTLGSNPLAIDSDRDGMPDAWEYQHGLDLVSPDDVSGNADADSLSNLAEYLLGTDPNDTDDDMTSSAAALVVSCP